MAALMKATNNVLTLILDCASKCGSLEICTFLIKIIDMYMHSALYMVCVANPLCNQSTCPELATTVYRPDG